MSTALDPNGGAARSYRFGDGMLDERLGDVVDAGEQRVYVEISNFSMPGIFFGRWR